MATTVPIPPAGQPVFDPKTGAMTEPWRRYWLSLENLGPEIPPIDAQYWVSTANTSLTNERNLGALASGFVKITVGAGVATPSTVPTVPAGDISGVLSIANGGTNSGTALTAAAIAVSTGSAIEQGPQGTTTTVLHGNAAGLPTYAAVDLTADVSGVLPVANGGTNVSAPTGVYTPTLTNVTNIAASTAYPSQWVRVNDTITVSGRVDLTPTAPSVATDLGVSLPVASNFAQTYQCAGVGFSATSAGDGLAILADVANDRAEFMWIARAPVAAETFSYIFTYRVV